MTEDRTNIHLLAAMICAAQDFKLPMQDCLDAAEGVLTEAELVDAQRQLDAKLAPPVTRKIQ